MLRQLLVGSAVSICNIAIHALLMTAQIPWVHTKLRPTLILIAIMVGTVSVLMVAHMLEVGVWALAYGIVEAAPGDANLLYFAYVNYTTLGYGDITPVKRWLLLGPMTAMNGVLLII